MVRCSPSGTGGTSSMPLVRPPSSKAREAEGPLRLPRTPRPCSACHAKLQSPPKDDVDGQATTANHQPPTMNHQPPTQLSSPQPPTPLSSFPLSQLVCPSSFTPEAPPPGTASFSAGTPLLGVPPPSPPTGRADRPSAHQRDRSGIFYIRRKPCSFFSLHPTGEKLSKSSSSVFGGNSRR